MTCEEKLAFNTEAEAMTAAAVAAYQHQDSKLEPYLCDNCGLWHLATTYTPREPAGVK